MQQVLFLFFLKKLDPKNKQPTKQKSSTLIIW